MGISADPTAHRHRKLGISSDATEDDALVMHMRQLIEPGSSLRSLVFWGSPTPNIIPILLGQSSLEELTINSDFYKNPNLLQKNTNLKKLVITCTCDLFPLGKLLLNYTSLTCLIIYKQVHAFDLFSLTELIQSHPTLKVLGIGSYYPFGGSGTAYLLQLVETTANSQLKRLLFSQQVYKLIPLDIQEQYKHVLGELP